MTEKCICDGWEWESFESWSTCPNCDFPADRLVWVKNLMSTADRRLELLRELDKRLGEEDIICLMCGGSNDGVHPIRHTDYCELAKEIKDETV